MLAPYVLAVERAWPGERLFVYLQFCPFIVFSVQFATEFTSRAAPRTVLHAARAIADPITTTVTAF
jgi:hypothetical protein